MKSFLIYIFSFHIFFGASFLPFGDFTSLANLPEWYSHCKAAEDADMTPIDFITDHLINIDGLFDKHDNGDHQKPHQPFHYTNTAPIVTGVLPYSITLANPPASRIITGGSQLLYEFRFTSSIFHPPLVSA
ncbi:MAG: hypothetical protein H3C35_00220 [Bacteroidetes bacterium]|nr:hypothetical protein [Bacteroidota bacterium]